MQKVIIFSNESGVAVMYPADCGMTVLDIGKKDVPEGVAFWTIDIDELPEDDQRTWELDHNKLGEPSGFGGTYLPVEKSE